MPKPGSLEASITYKMHWKRNQRHKEATLIRTILTQNDHILSSPNCTSADKARCEAINRELESILNQCDAFFERMIALMDETKNLSRQAYPLQERLVNNDGPHAQTSTTAPTEPGQISTTAPTQVGLTNTTPPTETGQISTTAPTQAGQTSTTATTSTTSTTPTTEAGQTRTGTGSLIDDYANPANEPMDYIGWHD